MLIRMRISGPKENTQRGTPDDPQGKLLRLIRIALWRERKHTEKLLKDQLLAISAEIGLVEEKILTKFEGIDASVSLIAAELARQSNDSPSNGTGG